VSAKCLIKDMKLPKIIPAPKSFEDMPEGIGSHWAFAIINGRLAEIHWHQISKDSIMPWAHAYVKRSAYKTKHEQKMIDVDIKKYIFTYRKKTGYAFAKSLVKKLA